MQLGFAVARYPSKTYLGAAALAAADERQRSSMQAANARLHAALDALGTTNLLLHIVGDKVLQLSTLNLETLQPETPPASFWEVCLEQLWKGGRSCKFCAQTLLSCLLSDTAEA